MLQQQDNKLLSWFLEKTLLSNVSQKLLQTLSGIASELSEDKNPVPEYEETLANYEAFKKFVLQQISLMSTYSANSVDAEDEIPADADLEALANVIAESAAENGDSVCLTVDDFIASLSDDEVEELYNSVFPQGEAEVAAYSAQPATRSCVDKLEQMKEFLKAALTEALNDLFAQLDKVFYDDMVHNFVYYFGVNYYAQSCEPGFDLLVSNDGVNFDAITRDGFGDSKNHGLRTIGSTEQGVYMGTANPFQGTQLWRMYSDRDLPLDTDEDAVRYNITVTSVGNGTASPSQLTAVEGKYVTLTAVADEGSSFEGWEVVSPAGLLQQIGGIRHAHTPAPSRREMRRRRVTAVPLPGTERTFTLSIKLSMMVKPMPLRSALPVVYRGCRACSTSAMPTPLSFTWISRVLSSNSRRRMVIFPRRSG